MKKIIIALFLILLILVVGCKKVIPEEPKLEIEVAEEDVETGISEIDILEEELNMSELEEIDSLLEELEE